MMDLTMRVGPNGVGADRLAKLFGRELTLPNRELSNGGGSTKAVVAEISDLARSFLQQLEESGAQAGSFDLHLDLEQLGVKIDGKGTRSAEGHKLTVDLHVEAEKGVFRTEDGREIAFERLEVKFTIEEMRASYSETPQRDYVGATSVAPPPGPPYIGPIDGQANRPRELLMDGLQKLVSLLDRIGNDVTVDDLGEFMDQVKELLGQVGKAFEEMGRGDAEVEFEAYSEKTEVTLQALSFTRAQPAEAEALPI